MKFIKKEYTLTGIVMHMENSVTGVMDAYLYVKPNAMVKLLDPNKKITNDNFGSIDSKKVTAIGVFLEQCLVYIKTEKNKKKGVSGKDS